MIFSSIMLQPKKDSYEIKLMIYGNYQICWLMSLAKRITQDLVVWACFEF